MVQFCLRDGFCIVLFLAFLRDGKSSSIFQWGRGQVQGLDFYNLWASRGANRLRKPFLPSPSVP